MNILAISVRIPVDGKKGDQVLSFHRLSYLAKHHKVQLVCFGSSVKDADSLAKLESLGIIVRLIDWNKFLAGIYLLKAIFDDGLPFQCALFQSTAYQKAVLECIAEFRPDAVYAVMIRSLVNLVSYSGPLFVDMVDSMGLNFSRRVAMERGLKRFVYELEYQRVSAYEQKVAKIATCSFVVSALDQKFIGNENVRALPLGFNVEQFYRKPDGGLNPVIVFSGNMNYKPNVDAVLWFYSQCWNTLKAALSDICWVIAGSNPTSEVLALRSDHAITVTGRVPSVAAVINASRVSIAPMQSGSGMQFKILEAMACGVPVVTTSLGLGDIGAEQERDVVIADTAATFIKAVLTLLQSPDLRESIGTAGFNYVIKHHSWDALNAEFEQATFATLKQ